MDAQPDRGEPLQTLVDLLRWRALRQGDRRAYTFLPDGEAEEVHLTCGELDRRARAVGARLQRLGVAGGRVMLLYPPGLEFLVGLFGCLYAGCIAVPAYPPSGRRAETRIHGIVADAQPRAALTTARALADAQRDLDAAPGLPSLIWLATDALAGDGADDWRDPAANDRTLAVLQYTSGSTAEPRGVMLTHGGILHNLRVVHEQFGVSSSSRGVCWLPHHHDMGLIGGILQPLYAGGLQVLMPPLSFLQRPFRWLQAISRYRAAINGGPTFAYDLCVQRTNPAQRASLDLSGWELAFVGAEPVREETLRRFATAFAPSGFRWEAFFPCYGLAEATVFVSGGPVAAPPVIRAAPGRAPEPEGATDPSGRADGGGTLVGCGRALPDPGVAIVDPESGAECPPGQVGEIWVAGHSVAQGYWNRPEETRRTFGATLAGTGDGPFLRTGDLGFVEDGQLFVTGRLKDLIIVDGRNHYPQDIEQTVERSDEALQPGAVAAFSVQVNGEERVVVAAQLQRGYHRERRDDGLDTERLLPVVRRAVAEAHDLRLYDVVLLKYGALPRTSSGKIQRHACRDGYLAGRLDAQRA